MTENIIMIKKILLNKNIILILFLSFMFNNSFAQNESRDEFLGEQNFKVYSYRIAINHFTDAYENDTLNRHILARLVVCNYNLRRFKAANDWATKLIDIDSSALNSSQLAYYIEILASNRKYDEASYWFSEYLMKDTTDEQQIERMRGFLSESEFSDVSADYHVHPVSFNSKHSDFGPSKFDDSTIVYTSARSANNWFKNIFKNDGIEFLGLYKVVRDSSGKFSEPEKFNKTIKSKYNEGPIAFYDSTKKVIFSQNKIKNRHWYGNRMAKSADTTNNIQLYMADYIDGKISNIIDFPFNNSDYTSAHATVSDDGQILIYASNMPGGEGGSDLYICKRAGNTWSSPRNLGVNINTENNELFPYLYKNILYFSSDGHKGIGSLDIYKTILLDGNVGKPINLGYPFNSNADDFSFFRYEDKSGLFSTNRSDEANDEIYFFSYEHITPPTVNVLALDTVTNEFIKNPDISIAVKDSVMQGLIPMMVSGDTMFTFIVDTTLSYDALSQKEGYLVNEEIFSYSDTNVWIIPMIRIDIGVTITLKNIYYDFDKASLRDSSKFELNKLINWLEDNSNVRIKLKSHTDSRGNDTYNMGLSERRAKSVVNYLAVSGIDTARLESQGMGETEPIYSCPNPADCTKEQHQANRRTEFEILSVTHVADSTDMNNIEQNKIEDQTPFENPKKVDKSKNVNEPSNDINKEEPKADEVEKPKAVNEATEKEEESFNENKTIEE